MAQKKSAAVSAAAKKNIQPLAHAVGRRKNAIARVWLRPGSGNIRVNGLEYERYFDTAITRQAAAKAFAVCPVDMSYDVAVLLSGGGKTSQSDAIKLGIARAIVSLDETMRPVMRQHGLLTVDSRQKERKKYGQRGARRKFQFVKR